MIYSAKCEKCGEVEIEKPMVAAFPLRHFCGGKVRRVFTPAQVIYAAPGFYSTDVTHFEKQVGKERAAKFYKQRDATLARAKAGRLTPYEKRLDAMDKAHHAQR